MVKSKRMPSKRSGFSATATNAKKATSLLATGSIGGQVSRQIKQGERNTGDLLKASRWISSYGTGHGRLR